MRVAALVVVLWAADAHAYPQLQLSTGTDTCAQCHVSPGGGGLLTEYGRDEALTLAAREAWTPPTPAWLGADLRGALGARGDQALAFPMQADLYLAPSRALAGGRATLYVAAGLRGAARGDAGGALPPVASREHYVMYRRGAWYARAGRFQPIWGLRLADHTAHVRRRLHAGLLEEPYGVAAGRLGGDDELHLSAFVGAPSPLLGTAEDAGVAAYWERRGDAGALGAQARVQASDDDRRAWVGAVHKRWLEASRLLVLVEGDAGVQAFAAGPSRVQLVGHAGVTYVAERGWLVGGAVQAFDPDLTLGGVTRAGAALDVQWFPLPRVELHLALRADTIALDADDPDLLALLQLHWFP